MLDPNCFEELDGKNHFFVSCAVAVILAIMILSFIGLVIYEGSKNVSNTQTEKSIESLRHQS